MGGRFQIYLIKPTRYHDDGYPLQWWRSIVPSNSLACMAGIVQDAIARGVLGDLECDVHTLDEIHSKVDPRRIARDIKRSGGRAFIGLVGVQSNQFPRTMEMAKEFRAADLPICIGGFHVSGCMSMLKELPPELVEAQAMGISFFGGEAEDCRIDEVLQDALNGELKPSYDWLKDTPNIEGAPIPFLPREQVDNNTNGFSSFDLGRGCPFECSFCTIINVQGRKSRFRSADDLEQIIRVNAAEGITRFVLTDDNFARNKNWEVFADRLIALREEGLAIKLVIQVDTLAHRIPRFIEKCVQMGVNEIFVGLENINADNLEAAKKRQNRVEEYREMFLLWKQHPVYIICGYIIGFPNDSYESIQNDIATLKRELPIDSIYLNYLTPLPGSEDHKIAYEAGQWMDPDLNKYDLNHRVTHHPTMSDAEWERAYEDAHRSFYSWDHMETVIRRMAALGSNQKKMTVNRLTAYREAVRIAGVAKFESGYMRIYRRKQRRPGFKIENPLIFYPKYFAKNLYITIAVARTYVRLRRFMKRVMKDPARFDYTDEAIVDDKRTVDVLLTATRSSGQAEIRRQHREDAQENAAA
ncbi:radical SAM protein [Parasphingopyxis sp. CP4]|uniref:B12-binding domain-containing radical SAM protein n=1 Tax=Parasphingopyxis sp. CP4 TaxID=2724527 RepID=UPI0015A2DA07|nr:radical SAM protein [Parasphingopyxis sp. CP4]QLC21951.1 radical SAM protein [Parasphingopyxis sp. CP4]